MLPDYNETTAWLNTFSREFLGEGVETSELNLLQISARALIIFLAALMMFRVAPKRFFAERNAIDVLLVLLLASTLSRAINGPAPLWATIGVGFVLVFLHKAVSWAACRSPAFGKWVKGTPYILVEDGKMREEVMLKHHISKHDLEEDLRLTGSVSDVAQVKIATLERNGEISILKHPKPHTIQVENRVHTGRSAS